ncbi:stage III sporulation protein AF [Blautia schinkii]|uniref:stage III sporulation protein AF n=1 Tax=Blautia schinkii TaxID=180164 RepID=UPI00156FBA5E|nr:stage III sporulation protein AF [Blautia schinkii]NSG83127.1 stage III sporulation protein AF [Blautia schinkii]NSK23732.1 stage III sporulation protein AF [Blautia schinkii]NSK26770.1 stage III sporulation protein AF [Blautia schinkii]NSK32879.1 stage III sporulation protein AF [Blautia schinkii]NSK48542.1 stage III sporulation protein AF [Blautia schinkii]
MRTEIYQWMKNLAFFHVLTTTVLHILPDKRYEQYIRLFMGLLLALMICTPVFALVGKSSELLNGFQKYYGEEEQARMENEAEGIRKTFLREAYKKELEKQIRRLLSDAGIFSEKISGVEAEITAEKKLLVKINLKAAITESQKEAVKNGLERICGLEETQYQILDSGNGVEGVGNPVAFGNSSSGGRTSGIPENK